jgi:hypothetical protein
MRVFKWIADNYADIINLIFLVIFVVVMFTLPFVASRG